MFPCHLLFVLNLKPGKPVDSRDCISKYTYIRTSVVPFSSGPGGKRSPPPERPGKGTWVTARQLTSTSSPGTTPRPTAALRWGGRGSCDLKPAALNLISGSKQQNEEWTLPGGILPLGLILPWGLAQTPLDAQSQPWLGVGRGPGCQQSSESSDQAPMRWDEGDAPRGVGSARCAHSAQPGHRCCHTSVSRFTFML